MDFYKGFTLVNSEKELFVLTEEKCANCNAVA